MNGIQIQELIKEFNYQDSYCRQIRGQLVNKVRFFLSDDYDAKFSYLIVDQIKGSLSRQLWYKLANKLQKGLVND